VAIDDHSRYADVEVLENERGDTCAEFLERSRAHLATLGVAIEGLHRLEALSRGARFRTSPDDSPLPTTDQRQSRAIQSHPR
jgi:hypothetical protein